MSHWLDEYPALRIMRKVITAEDYNRVRLGLLREHLPWHVPLKQFRCLSFILDSSVWVCVDECRDGMPILAWTRFKTQNRSGLDAPVECELRLYHMHAGLIMGSTLDALAVAITDHLRQQPCAYYPVSKLTSDMK